MNDADVIPPPDPAPAPFPLTEAKTLVGRKRECDLVVYDTKCSKFHARIYREDEAFRLLDLGSQNGTFVNEERITSRVLESGDRVRFGYSVYRFLREGEGESGSTTLTFIKKVQPAEEDQAGPAGGEAVPSGEPLALPGSPSDGPGGKEEPPARTASDGPDTERLPAVPMDSPRSDPETKEPVAVGPWVPLAGAAILLAMVVLFSEELRALLGLATEKKTPPSPAPASAAKTNRPPLVEGITREELTAELDRLERRLRNGAPSKGREDLADRIDALGRDLGPRLGVLESRNATLLAAIESLRKELAARAPPSPSKETEAGKAEPELPPEEKLLREIMNALNKGE